MVEEDVESRVGEGGGGETTEETREEEGVAVEAAEKTIVEEGMVTKAAEKTRAEEGVVVEAANETMSCWKAVVEAAKKRRAEEGVESEAAEEARTEKFIKEVLSNILGEKKADATEEELVGKDMVDAQEKGAEKEVKGWHSAKAERVHQEAGSLRCMNDEEETACPKTFAL